MFTRDFVLAFCPQFTLSVTSNVLLPTLPIYLSRLGSTEEEIGILVGAISITALIFRPLVGRALLTTPEKTLMWIGALLFSFSSAAYLWAPPFWPLLTVRVLQGIGMAFFYTSSIALATRITPEAHRAQGLGYFFLAFNFAFALGPMVGMFIINSFDFTVLFLFCTALSLSSLLLTSRLEKSTIDPPHDSSFRLESFISVESLPIAGVSFLAHFIWGALTTFVPLYALNHGIQNPGYFFGAYATTMILGRVLGGKILDTPSRPRIILFCLSFHVLGMIILIFSKTLPMLILVAAVWGMGSAFLVPALAAYMLERITSSPGFAMATFSAMGDLGAGLGSVIMGGVLQLSSYPVMFLCVAVTTVLNVAYFCSLVRWTKAKRGGVS